MARRKLERAVFTTDENDDGWLSTRNKKKISPPPLKTRGGHHFLRRPIPRSPLMMLMDDSPLPLQTTKKQTSIADYFSPRLKGLPSTDEAGQTPILQEKDNKQEETEAHWSEDNIYADFNMPAPTPSQNNTRTSQNTEFPDADLPGPTAPQANTVPRPVSTHFTRVHSLATLQTAKMTTLSCLSHKTADILPCGQSTLSEQTDHRTDDFGWKKNILSPCEEKFCEQPSNAKEHRKRKRNACSDSLTDGDIFTGQVDENVDNCNRKTCQNGFPLCQDRIRSQADQRVDKCNTKKSGLCPADRKNREDQALPDTGSLQQAQGENCVHKHPPQSECDMVTTNDKDAFPDSLQTPCFLKETCNTLNFSQLPAVARAGSKFEEAMMKTRSKPSKAVEHFLGKVDQTQQKRNNFFEGFTKPKTLHFTEEFTEPNSLHFTEELTEPNSLHFTEALNEPNRLHFTEEFTDPNSLHCADDDPPHDSQHRSSSPHPWNATVDEKLAEQKLTVASSCDEEQCDSLQTPAFLSSETGPDDSQLAGRWREGSQLTEGWTEGSQLTEGWTEGPQLAAPQTLTTGKSGVDSVTSFTVDLQTPGFLAGSQEDSSSVDMF